LQQAALPQKGERVYITVQTSCRRGKEIEKHKLKRHIFLRATMELARLSGPDRFQGAGEQ